jgi:prevent-host-death family protein
VTILMTMSTRGPRARSIGAGEFKAKCLELMDDVAETGEPLIITKRGRPVAKLVPAASPQSLIGLAKDWIEITGDIVAPVEMSWAPRPDRAALIDDELSIPPRRKKTRRRGVAK